MIPVMEDERNYLSRNIKRLMAIAGIPSMTNLADRCAGEITPKSITRMVNTPDEGNPTLEKMQVIARALKVKPWMLLLEDFPFEDTRREKNLNKISANGYEMLRIFEEASIEKQQSMLDYAAYNLRENPGAERAIRVLQAKYNTKDSSMC